MDMKFSLRFLSIFIFVILCLSLKTLATDYVQTNTNTYGTSQSINATGGMVFCNNVSATVKTIIKPAGDAATKCYIYPNSTSVSYYSPLANGTFSGDNCTISYYATAGSCLIYAADAGPASYTQYYGTPTTFISTSIGTFYSAILTNGPRTVWSQYSNFVFSVKTIVFNITETPPPAENTTFFELTAKGTDGQIFNFSAVIDDVTYNTTNGTINTGINSTLGTLKNISFTAFNYIPKTVLNHNVSTNLQATLTNMGLSTLSYSNYTTVSGNQYTRYLNYFYNYTCQGGSTTYLNRYINGVLNNSASLSCDNTTQSNTIGFQRTTEGQFNISFTYTTDIGQNSTITNSSFYSDIINPVSTVQFVYSSDFVLPVANLSLTCTDNVMTTLLYNMSFNNVSFYLNNKTAGSTQINTTSSLLNGNNVLQGICSDLFGSSTDTKTQNLELRTLYIIDEQNNVGFNVANISSVKVYLDDNRTSYDFKANGKNNITFVAANDVKLRFELVYGDGTVILRYVDTSLLQDDIRVCANREGTIHYEQLLISSTERAVVLKSVFADCIVAADYTRFAYQDTTLLKAYTQNNLYYLYTFNADGQQVFLTSVDGSIATYINLDTLEFSQEGYNINLAGDGLAIEKVNANEVKLRYINAKDDNTAIRIAIYRMDTDETLFNSTSFADPNDVTIIFNHATLPNINATTTVFKVLVDRTAGGEIYRFNKYFNVNGETGGINPTVIFIIGVFVLMFGFTFTVTQTTFSWFGIVISLVVIALTTFATATWYITFLQMIAVIFMIYTVLVMMGKNQITITG